jgi:hypothetical protein
MLEGTMRWGPVAGALAIALVACAEGVDEHGSIGTPNRLDDGGDTTTTTGGPAIPKGQSGDDDGPTPGGDLLPDFGTCSQDSDCFAPAVLCFSPQGTCVAGNCEHPPLAPGAPCNDGDACTEDDMCDGAGGCVGNDIECSGPNTSGGVCNAGVCSGQSCVAGFGDCNGDMNDGCETPLNTTSNCGGCGAGCTAGAHATTDCGSGSCQRSCQSPYENCDGDWGNGCEIPTGVPHQCSAAGLDPVNGCWTAYCGTSVAAAANFGTFHCIDCATCRAPAAGVCQWCAHGPGVFYPTDACYCGAYEDLVCS